MKLSNIRLGDDLVVTLKPQSPRIMQLYPMGEKYEILDDKGEIIGINYQDEVKIEVGKAVKAQSGAFKPVKIEKASLNGGCYILKSHEKLTRSTVYLLPFFGSDKNSLMYRQALANCFIEMEGDESSEDEMYLMYRFEGSKNYAMFEGSIEKMPWHQKTILVDSYQTVYKVGFPEQWREDMLKLIKGKYSEISKEAKTKLIEFHGWKPKSDNYKVLYKDNSLRISMQEKLGFPIEKGSELKSDFKVKFETLTENYFIL